MNLQELTRRQYLEAMDITVWQSRQRREEPAADAAPAALMEQAVAVERLPKVEESRSDYGNSVDNTINMDWPALEAAVRACQKCELHKTRTQTVFGVGDRQAQWMFVGEAPGADEDRQGEPFVGKAGQLLNAMLQALNLKREQVYIANVLKCRPPNNRDPQPQEVGQCEPYLARQIALVNPKIIVALGRHAVHNLLKTDLALGKLRGQKLSYNGIPLLATYHPAYLLRNPVDKRKAWEDLCLARKIVEQS